MLKVPSVSRRPIAQGDVLFVPVDSIPKDAVPVEPQDGRYIIEYGEVTGHVHAFALNDVTVYSTSRRGQYINVIKQDAPLTHDEHSVIPFELGAWQRWVQVEGDPGEERQVSD